MRLKDKIAIVTGAGSGMGRAIARRFAAEGARVVCVDRSGAQDAVAAELGGAAIAVQADVAIEDEVKAMIAVAETHFGRLDILVNCAGFGGGTAPLHTQTSEKWDEVHGVNLRGVFLGMKYGIAAMLRSGGGAIVNIGSTSAVVGWKNHGVYAAAKAGVHQLTKVAALDYSLDNIRVNAIAPGLFWTGLARLSKQFSEPPEGIYRPPGIPLDRWGRPEEIASAALFLASDEAAYITGVVLPVDGGYAVGFSGLGAEVTGEGLYKP